jgi:phospholipase/lecithinase/hemolysin
MTSGLHQIVIAAIVPFAALSLAPEHANAFGFTTIYSFGDSLSDTGNSFKNTGGLIPPNLLYPSNGRFSNGPVWTEYLAPKLGASLETLAVGGARTDNTNNFSNLFPSLGGLSQQVDTVTTGDPNALYVLWLGANDYLNGASRDPVPTVTNLTNAVLALANVGAKNFAIGNLPNLGSVPGTRPDPLISIALNQLTQAHNSLLAQSLAVIGQTQPQLNLYTLDFNSLFNDAIANPGKYGFTNVTDSCLLTFCSTPNTYLFWDEIHPTTAGHFQLAEFAYGSIQAQAVPEPTTIVGLFLGGAFLTGLKTRRNQSQRTAKRSPQPAQAPTEV